jgi:TRAP-type transport system periplasmic protein
MARLADTAFVGAAVLSGAALAVMSWPAAAQTTLTMSSWVSPSHLLTKDVLAVWGQQVEKATNGRVKLQMLPKHPSAAPGTFDAVRDDLVDVSYVTASYTPARHVLPLIAELPGGGATSVINSVAYSRIHWKYLQQAGEYKGVKLLAVFTHGPGQMFNTKRPITKVEDLASSRSSPSSSGARILRAAQLRRRRRHVLPARVDHLLQARVGDQVRDAVSRRLLQLLVRLLHE